VSNALLDVMESPDRGRRRASILKHAADVFMERGFDVASMRDIARAAAVSKATLYQYFPDKSALFTAVIGNEMRGHGAEMFVFRDETSLQRQIEEFGKAYVEAVCRPQSLSIVRTVAAIADRMPAVGHDYYKDAWEMWASRLSTHLRHRAEVNEFVTTDFDLAAAQFMQLCLTGVFLPRVFKIESVLCATEIDAAVREATETFMSRFRIRAGNIGND
jgi:AcrR family transcriptional regulator